MEINRKINLRCKLARIGEPFFLCFNAQGIIKGARMVDSLRSGLIILAVSSTIAMTQQIISGESADKVNQALVVQKLDNLATQFEKMEKQRENERAAYNDLQVQVARLWSRYEVIKKEND